MKHILKEDNYIQMNTSINYLREIKNMLKNINERMKNYGGGMEFNDLSGSFTHFDPLTGLPISIDTYSDIFYYIIYKLVYETLAGDWELDIKEILREAFDYYIIVAGKLKGEHNKGELSNAFRECLESAAERANLYSEYGWFTGNGDDEARRGAAKYKSSRRKYNPSRSKASRSKASRSKDSRSKPRRNKHRKSKPKKSKRVKSKPKY